MISAGSYDKIGVIGPIKKNKKKQNTFRASYMTRDFIFRSQARPRSPFPLARASYATRTGTSEGFDGQVSRTIYARACGLAVAAVRTDFPRCCRTRLRAKRAVSEASLPRFQA